MKENNVSNLMYTFLSPVSVLCFYLYEFIGLWVPVSKYSLKSFVCSIFYCIFALMSMQTLMHKV